MTPLDASNLVRALAHEVGFDLVGVTRAAPIARGDYVRRWLQTGRHGTMSYLARNSDMRVDPSRILPGAKSVICVALNYRRNTADIADEVDSIASAASPPSLEHSAPTTSNPPRTNTLIGRIAQYARGTDYHVVLRDMLDALVVRLRERLSAHFDARVFVDTGPLIERELAAAAGLGWIGKNTCVIHPRLGSFTFLGEIVTTLDLAPDNDLPDHCGSCTRCLDACPTRAFPAPYEMDARRCISYLTIEHRGDIDPALHAGIGDWVYGCDICQDVCPFNARSPVGIHPAITADRLPARIKLEPLTTLFADDHKQLTAGTAADRAKPDMWRRNAQIASANLKRLKVDPAGSLSPPTPESP